MAAEFLDQSNLSFGLSNDGRKVWAIVLFLSVIMHRKVMHVNLFAISVISAGPRFVEIHKPWQPRQRDVTISPLYRMTTDIAFSPKMRPLLTGAHY